MRNNLNKIAMNQATRMCVFLLWLTTAARGDSPPSLSPAERKAWVGEQITRLDADTLSERSEAEQALIQAGPIVLPLLPAPDLLPNTAVRQAVRRIRLRLEETKAKDSIKPTVVTLDETATLDELLKKMTQQTGNRLDASQLPQTRREESLPVSVQGISFWRTLDFLGERFGFRWESSTGAEQASLVLKAVDAKQSNPLVDYVGAFRVAVEPPGLRPRFGEEIQQLLRVPFRLSAEPRLRPLFLKLEGKDFSARTQDGKPLTPFNPNAKLELPLGEGGSETSFRMDFQVPKPFEKTSIQLQGKATLTVAAGAEDIAFSNLPHAKGTARRRGGVTVRLNEISFQPDEKHPNRQAAKLRVTVHYDTGGPAFESHRVWMFHNQVYLEDAQNRRVERNSNFHTALQTDGGVIVEYNFENLAGKPSEYKFIYIAPTLIINVPVAFEFKELPIRETK